MPTLLDTQQITLRSILRDETYYKWFRTPPAILPTQQHSDLPPAWWVYIQDEEDGRWRRGGARTYKQAFSFVKKHLNEAHDLAITSKRRAYIPPVHRPVRNGKTARHREYWHEYPRTHNWCPYCRRPTVFAHFKQHHADGEIRRTFSLPSNGQRCCICGISEVAVKPWMDLGRI